LSKIQAVPAAGHPDWMPEGGKPLDLHSFDGARGATSYDEETTPSNHAEVQTFEEMEAVEIEFQRNRVLWMIEKGVPTGLSVIQQAAILDGHTPRVVTDDVPDVVLDFAEDDVDDNGDIVDEEPEVKKSVGRPRKTPV